MCVTKQGITVASGFEYEVASELVNRGRRFEKPPRYAVEQNHPEGHPGFWLTDAHKPVRMEVFGMNHQAKIAEAWEEHAQHDFWTWFPVDCEPRRADSLERAMSALPRGVQP